MQIKLLPEQKAAHSAAPDPDAQTHHIELPTGTLTLTVHDGQAIEPYCDFAARANPKRGFLIVSKLLGRHLPARPAAMRRTMAALTEKLPHILNGPILFLGMAETATALGQGVFAAYKNRHPDCEAIYLQSSRQTMDGAICLASFEEGHSHATTHLVQLRDHAMLHAVRQARALVIVDDECSSGQTFLAAAQAMKAALPTIERIETLCITDWSNARYIQDMPVPTTGHALISGSLIWNTASHSHVANLAPTANQSGKAPALGMQSRTGITSPEKAQRHPVSVTSGERITVLGDGEHSYEALLIAEEIEASGGIAAVQSITRSPALAGHAMQSISLFQDSYGSGASCFLYNILGHRPDRIIIAAEKITDQVHDARAALDLIGSGATVEAIECRYPASGETQ